MRRWGVAATILCLAVVSGCAGEAVSVPPSPVVATPTQRAEALRLGDVPGLGNTAASMLRDDTIAYWESWARAEQVNECMAEFGFVWEPEVAYPRAAASDVAKALGIEPKPEVGQRSATAVNRAYEAMLTHSELDGYFQALFAESAKDVAYARDHDGLLPASRRERPFAEGGCIGVAATQVGSVWQLKRDLADELLDLRRAGPDAVLTQEDLGKHPALQKQIADYASIMDTISADSDFMDYVATALHSPADDA